MKRKTFFTTTILLFLLVLATAGGFLIRARFLPDVDVPILLFDRIGMPSDDASIVPVNLFYLQMRDLASNDYRTVTPAQLRAYRIWGLPLPERPFMITFDTAYRDLLTVVAPILKEQNFTAVVNLATTYVADQPGESRSLNGEPILSWAEIQKVMDEGIFTFGGHTRNLVDLTRHINPFNEIRASRTDIKRATGVRTSVFSYPFGRYTPELAKAARDAKIDFAMTYGDTIAKIGPRTDLLALPRIRVVGGRHTFSAQVVERRSSVSFGQVRVTHPIGASFPLSIVVFDHGARKPIANLNVPGIERGDTVELLLPADIDFPVEVEVLDANRVLLYFANIIPRSAVIREMDSTGRPIDIDYVLELDPME